MEPFPSDTCPFLIGVAVLALALVGWLVYRNLKDEDEFEHDLDDPKQEIEKHSKDDKT